MSLAFRPPSLRIYTEQQDHPEPPLETNAVEAPPAAEASVKVPDAPDAVGRSERRSRSALKERIQAGSATFEFDALLQGVSTLHERTPLKSAANAKDGAELLWIPAGEFRMGSNEGERREQPIHRVVLDGFWIYKAQVTVGQFRRFCAAIGRSLRHAPHWGLNDEHPIVNITWEQAGEYAQWAGAALPTEAEWERAARGVDGRIYPWGDTWDPKQCHNSVGKRQNGVACVGSYPHGASPEGVMDMAGNVWEWTADWYEEIYYARSPDKNPTGPIYGKHRVIRGGGWSNNTPHDYRAAARTVCDPALRSDSIGFRCVVHTDTLPSPQGQ